MKITNIYDDFVRAFDSQKEFSTQIVNDQRYSFLFNTAVEWEVDLENVKRWMLSEQYIHNKKVAKEFSEKVLTFLESVTKYLGLDGANNLPGELKLSPSLMTFDGFARYDSGTHTIWFGIDHPDASEDYLKALLAHELSHVFRDHQPHVWKNEIAALGKSKIQEFTRADYLDALTPEEHLVSEGLATLFSQQVFPEVDPHVHHFYFPEEFVWCLNHLAEIEAAIQSCMKGDRNIWRFYGDDQVAPGSPARVQYFWAAYKLMKEMESQKAGRNIKDLLIDAHGKRAKDFTILE